MNAERAGFAPPPLFHVVLHEPEIPNNTGNIGRTCIATHCALHLIRPLGFDTSEKACRRAGLDYWPRLRPTEHESFEAYVRWCMRAAGLDTPSQREGAGGWAGRGLAALGTNTTAEEPSKPTPCPSHWEGTSPPRLWLFTTQSHAGSEARTRSIPVFDADLRPGDHLVFGKETRGLPDELLERYADRLVTLPMALGERSLNLATAVCAAVYEGLRQLRARGEIGFSTDENRIVTG